jgi:hypothetical protein
MEGEQVLGADLLVLDRGAAGTKVNSTSAYEVNIFDTRRDPSFGTGAIVDVAKAATVLLAHTTPVTAALHRPA